MKKLHVFLLALGLGFVIYLTWRIGVAELFRELTLLGWGLVPLVLAEGVAEAFHAVSWRYCLSGPLRSISLPHLFRISMAGYAISYLTPTASLGGDVTKAGLLALNHKGPEAVSGVLIGKLSFAIAHLLFVILGSIVILPRIALPGALQATLLSGSLLMAFGIAAFLWIQKRGKLGAVVRWLVLRKFGGKTLERIAGGVSEVDEALKVFYRERPWGLPLAVFWHLVGYAVGVFQIWYFMLLLADHSSLVLAGKVWFIGLWFDLLTFTVPMSLGVLEGSRIVAFRAVGHDPLLGMTYSVAIRLAQLFWAAIGLMGYALLISKEAALPKRSFRGKARSSQPIS